MHRPVTSLSSGRHGPGMSSLTYLLGGGRGTWCRRRCWQAEGGTAGRLHTEPLFPAQGQRQPGSRHPERVFARLVAAPIPDTHVYPADPENQPRHEAKASGFLHKQPHRRQNHTEEKSPREC